MLNDVRDCVATLIRYRPGLFWLAIGAALCATLLEGAGIITLLPLLELAQAHGPMGGMLAVPIGFISRLGGGVPPLSVILVVFVAVVGLRSIMLATREYLAARLRLGFADELRDRLFDTACAADWIQVVRYRRSNLIYALSEEITRIDQGIRSLLVCISTIFLVLAQLSIAFLLSVKLTLFVLAGSVLGLRFAGGLLRRSMTIGRHITDVRQRSMSAAADALYALKQLKSHAHEPAFRSNFSSRQHELRATMLRYVRVAQLSDAGFQMFAASGLAATLWLAIHQFHFSLAQTAILVLIFARLVPGIATIPQTGREFLIAVSALKDVLRTIAELKAFKATGAAGTHSFQESWHAIRFEDVSFEYSEDGGCVLTHLDFSIRANTTTVLLGPSGCGKTTTLDLLIGLLRPTEGRVSVDNVPMDSLDPIGWRNRLAYVAQDGMLFNASIRENLTFGLADVGDERLAEALDLAGAAGIVAAAEHGLDTAVGDRGARFSGGERQRLALAQALLRRPTLLLLDEPTSSLDERNTELIVQTLRQLHGSMTIVIATHDVQLAKLADQTLHLQATPAIARKTLVRAG